MKLSSLFIEMWSFETIHCLNFNVQRRKRHDLTNDVKVKFMICGLVGCMKKMLVLFLLSLACVNGICINVNTESFLPEVCMRTCFQNSDSCLGKCVAMETYGMITKKFDKK